MSRKGKIYLAVIVLFTVLATTYFISKSRTFQFFGELYSRVETEQNVVALTFDDGPTAKTDTILNILKEKNVKATFFLNGNNIQNHLPETKRIIAAGHELGNHSWSHKRMVFKTYRFIKNEIEKTDSMMRIAGYKEEVHFRPPYGKKLLLLPHYLNEHNRKTIMWDVEPETYGDIAKSSEKITNHVLENTNAGSIILLHVMVGNKEASMNSVIPIIDGLREKGFEFKTVSELLNIKENN